MCICFFLFFSFLFFSLEELGRERGGGGECDAERHTFSGVARFVVLGEPAQVKVLDPWHPPLVLLVVDLLAVLGPGLPLLVAFRGLGDLGLLDVCGHREWGEESCRF